MCFTPVSCSCSNIQLMLTMWTKTYFFAKTECLKRARKHCEKGINICRKKMAAKLYWILLHFSKQKQFYQSKWQQHPRKASLSACCKTSSSPHKHTNRVIIYPSLQCVLLPVERKWNIRICRIWSQSRLKRTSLIFQLGTKTHSFFTALSSCSSSHHYLLPTQNNREDRGRKGGVGGGGAECHIETVL